MSSHWSSSSILLFAPWMKGVGVTAMAVTRILVRATADHRGQAQRTTVRVEAAAVAWMVSQRARHFPRGATTA
jgi:hypothetical protein